MIKILEALLPVLLMMELGAFCKARGWQHSVCRLFVKTEEGSTYIATTNSLYCLVSIAVYAIAAFFVR